MSPQAQAASAAVAVEPLSPMLGARITGVDLRRPLDDATFAAIHRAFLDRHVVSVPGQQLTVQQLLDYSGRFGPLEPHVMKQFHHAESPLILVLSNVQRDGKPTGLADAGTYWHSDVSYKARPSRASTLYAVQVPDEGGDTLFVDMVAAYDDLPEATRQRIDGLRAAHNYAYRSNQLADSKGVRPPLSAAQLAETPEVVHPVVRTHPETGRKALFINPGFTVRIEGLTEAESDALKAELFEHCLQDKYRLRYKWSPGDVLLWDNAAVMHYATSGELRPDQHRTMWRTIISGDVPY